MTEGDLQLYSNYLHAVSQQVSQLRVILAAVDAKAKERQWLKLKTSGDLDDTYVSLAPRPVSVASLRLPGDSSRVSRGRKRSTSIAGSVSPRRAGRRRSPSGWCSPLTSLHRCTASTRLIGILDLLVSRGLVLSVVCRRLERMLETVVMIMEALKGFEHKYSYSIVGHSGTPPRPSSPRAQRAGDSLEWVDGRHQETDRRCPSSTSDRRPRTRKRRSRCCARCTPTLSTVPAETPPLRYDHSCAWTQMEYR